MKRMDNEQLIGKTISKAIEDDDGHLHLRFTDGTEAEIEGSGYDGLWTSVYVTWSASSAPETCVCWSNMPPRDECRIHGRQGRGQQDG